MEGITRQSFIWEDNLPASISGHKRNSREAKGTLPDASPVLSAHVDERWVVARCTRNPGFGKDPKGLIMGFRPEGFQHPYLLPFRGRAQGSPCALEGGLGSDLRIHHGRGVWHTPFLLCPLHSSSWHYLMLSPARSVLPAKSA